MAGNNELVEELDEKMALRMLYDGAIYPHARDTYRVGYLYPCSEILSFDGFLLVKFSSVRVLCIQSQREVCSYNEKI